MAVAAGLAAAVSCSGPEKKLSTYWDGHDFSSTETFKDIKAAEDTFEGFIDLLVQSPYEVSVPVLNEFLDSAAGNPVAYTLWSGWFEPYLHLLESPYRNDSLFTVWLDRTIADKVLDDYMMEHLLDMRKVNGQNRLGMSASDVLLRDASGMEFRLSELKGEKIMLCLLDANCPSCIQTMNTVTGSAGAAGMRLVSVLKKDEKNKSFKGLDSELIESAGTLHLISVMPAVIMALKRGATFIVDEFDASLHPMIVMNIISIFHNDEVNTKKAQLIFNTHNPIYLNSKLLRRDEIKFVERDKETKESILYSLSDFKANGSVSVRKTSDYMKNYFISRYGAIVDMDFTDIIKNCLANAKEEELREGV